MFGVRIIFISIFGVASERDDSQICIYLKLLLNKEKFFRPD